MTPQYDMTHPTAASCCTHSLLQPSIRRCADTNPHVLLALAGCTNTCSRRCRSVAEARGLQITVGSQGCSKVDLIKHVCHSPTWPFVSCSDFKVNALVRIFGTAYRSLLSMARSTSRSCSSQLLAMGGALEGQSDESSRALLSRPGPFSAYCPSGNGPQANATAKHCVIPVFETSTQTCGVRGRGEE